MHRSDAWCDSYLVASNLLSLLNTRRVTASFRDGVCGSFSDDAVTVVAAFDEWAAELRRYVFKSCMVRRFTLNFLLSQ
jgi:hypothetical protein